MAKKHTVPLRKRVERRAGGCALLGVAWLFRLLPAGAGDRAGLAVGRLLHRLSKKYRNRATANLRMCFPDWPDAKVQQTALMVFEHFGKTASRFLRAPNLTDAQVLSSVQAHGMDEVDAALAEGKGVLVVTAHFGNWERMAHYASIRGYRLTVVARDTDDERATRLVNLLRRKQGFDVVSRRGAPREVVRRLKRNEIVGILPDQNTWEIYVPFFGKPAGTVAGPAVIHLLTGAPILSAFCAEADDGTYRLDVRRLDMPRLSGDRHEDARRIMTRVNEAIEEAVRRRPEQWLWMHDRWKSAREEGLLDA